MREYLIEKIYLINLQCVSAVYFEVVKKIRILKLHFVKLKIGRYIFGKKYFIP